ncbi:MAG: DUF2784 domain-containing protein [Marinilabiliales bacterium]|nr:MAG: DUF2784 domain-containing protein [Marinilabiliales bacterium]
MDSFWLKFLDAFFIIFHSLFTLFNITGWVWKKTRKIHLITMIITLLSWTVAGIWYGLGYCFCTDWHWQIKTKLGEIPDTHSYIVYLIKETTGIKISETLADISTLIVFTICLILTILLNIKDFKKNDHTRSSTKS